MRSLRHAAAVTGVDGSFSLAHDFLGFFGGVPDRDISVRAHVDGMLGPHFTLNMVRISHEDFTGTDLDNIDVAVQDARDIYAQVGVGVNVDHYHVDRADAAGFRVITKRGRARKLMRRFRGPGRRNLDILLVLVLQIPDGDFYAAGQSAGPDSPTKCKDKDRAGMRGVALGMNFALYGFGFGATSPSMRARSVLGYALAHEAGHLLMGKDHVGDTDNLMAATTGGADDLTEEQGARIRASCAVEG